VVSVSANTAKVRGYVPRFLDSPKLAPAHVRGYLRPRYLSLSAAMIELAAAATARSTRSNAVVTVAV
jgi:hypothetical protein